MALLTDATDEDIARLVQQGDQEAFGELMHRYEGKLLRYGRRFLANSDAAEDAVQESFIKAYQNIQSFDSAQRFSPWMYRIAHNQFISSIRKQGSGPLFLELDTLVGFASDDDTSLLAEREQTKAVLEKVLDRIPGSYREVLVLFYFEDLDYQAISDVLRIPVGTVGVRLRRARALLKKELGDTFIHTHE